MNATSAVEPVVVSVIIDPTVGKKGFPVKSKFVNLASTQPFHLSATVCSVSFSYVKGKFIALGSEKLSMIWVSEIVVLIIF